MQAGILRSCWTECLDIYIYIYINIIQDIFCFVYGYDFSAYFILVRGFHYFYIHDCEGSFSNATVKARKRLCQICICNLYQCTFNLCIQFTHATYAYNVRIQLITLKTKIFQNLFFFEKLKTNVYNLFFMKKLIRKTFHYFSKTLLKIFFTK